MADKGSRKGKFVMNRGYMCPGRVQQLNHPYDSYGMTLTE